MSFSHSDGVVIITPIDGDNEGKDLVLESAPKGEFDPGGKSSYGKGLSQTPIFIATGSAEPKLSMDLSSGNEGWKVVNHVGGIGNGSRCTISWVFRRDGVPTKRWKFVRAQLTNGGGFSSDEGSGVSGKLEWMLIDARLDGKSVYAKNRKRQRA
jgi:hypothetical protein